MRACAPSFPSTPTSCATRVTSDEKAASCDTIPLTRRAWRRKSPRRGVSVPSTSMVWPRSPFATAERTRATSVVWAVTSSSSSFKPET